MAGAAQGSARNQYTGPVLREAVNTTDEPRCVPKTPLLLVNEICSFQISTKDAPPPPPFTYERHSQLPGAVGWAPKCTVVLPQMIHIKGS